MHLTERGRIGEEHCSVIIRPAIWLLIGQYGFWRQTLISDCSGSPPHHFQKEIYDMNASRYACKCVLDTQTQTQAQTHPHTELNNHECFRIWIRDMLSWLPPNQASDVHFHSQSRTNPRWCYNIPLSMAGGGLICDSGKILASQETNLGHWCGRI